MEKQTKVCQNCSHDFVIESDDFTFYEKIKVPPPTFCPECRLVRRMNFKNERSFYKRSCDLCSKKLSLFTLKIRHFQFIVLLAGGLINGVH